MAYGRTDGRMYVRTDSQVTTKIFEIDGLSNFLRYGASLAREGAQELRYKKMFLLLKTYRTFLISANNFFFGHNF